MNVSENHGVPSHGTTELAERIREALAVPGRPGIRVIAKQLGVSPMTVQNVARV
jgi:DNA-binding Lrp family transcriptional regulator